MYSVEYALYLCVYPYMPVVTVTAVGCRVEAEVCVGDLAVDVAGLDARGSLDVDVDFLEGLFPLVD